jgi:hypothetical protein
MSTLHRLTTSPQEHIISKTTDGSSIAGDGSAFVMGIGRYDSTTNQRVDKNQLFAQ